MLFSTTLLALSLSTPGADAGSTATSIRRNGGKAASVAVTLPGSVAASASALR